MTVAYVNSGTIANTSFATTITVTMPASLVANRLLICMVQCTISGTPTLTFNGVGWTKFYDNSNFGARRIQLWYKVTSGTESTFTVTTSSNQSIEGQVHQFSGNLTSGNIIRTIWATGDFASNASQTFAGPAAQTDGSLYVAYVSRSAVPTAVAGGWTQAVNQTTGFQTYSLWTFPVTTAGFLPALWMTYGTGWTSRCVGFEICSSATLNTAAYSTPYPISKEQFIAANALTNPVVPVPLNRTIGNVLALVVWYASAGVISSVGTGWTRVNILPSISSTSKVDIWWRVIDGTEADTITLTTTTNNIGQATVMEWTNINTTLPFGNLQSVQQNTGSVTSGTHTGFATSQDNSTAICVYSAGSTSSEQMANVPTSGSFSRLLGFGGGVFDIQAMGLAGSATGADPETWSTAATYQANMIEAFLAAPLPLGRNQAIFVGT